tara:strand:- start:12345 stop:14201 length:1857 start_codon:yes stop_codon:yes gene_type:complete
MLENIPNDIMESIIDSLPISDIQNLRKTNKCFLQNTEKYKNSLCNIEKFDNETKNAILKLDIGFFIPKRLNLLYNVKHYFLMKENKSIVRWIDFELFKFHEKRMKVFEKPGLTQDQLMISQFPFKNAFYTIQAFAGTGKTTTLVEIAKNNKNKKILYLAFNSALAESATEKFKQLSHVDVFTIHALALMNVGKYEIDKMKAQVIMDYLDCEYRDSCVIKRILYRYLASSNKKPNMSHVLSEIPHIIDGEFLLENVKTVWNAMKFHKIPMCHDGYLKLFMQKNKQLEYDMIFVDEAQDINACMTCCIKQQNTCVIFVGDQHQQIYGFRHVYNIFNDPEIVKNFYLKNCFRFGYELSFLTNLFLKYFKHEKVNIIPADKETKIVSSFEINDKYTLICRSNKKVLLNAMKESENFKIKLLGKQINFSKEKMKINELHNLNINDYSSYYKLECFGSLAEACVYFQSIGKQRWIQRIQIFQELGYENYIEGLIALETNYCNENPDIIISTLHQTKGLEFDNVKLCDDWNLIDYRVQTVSSIETYNVLYVALTRAKQKLILNRTLENVFTKLFDSTKLKKMIETTNGQCKKCKMFKSVNKIQGCYSYSSINIIDLICHDCIEPL